MGRLPVACEAEPRASHAWCCVCRHVLPACDPRRRARRLLLRLTGRSPSASGRAGRQPLLQRRASHAPFPTAGTGPAARRHRRCPRRPRRHLLPRRLAERRDRRDHDRQGPARCTARAASTSSSACSSVSMRPRSRSPAAATGRPRSTMHSRTCSGAMRTPQPGWTCPRPTGPPREPMPVDLIVSTVLAGDGDRAAPHARAADEPGTGARGARTCPSRSRLSTSWAVRSTCRAISPDRLAARRTTRPRSGMCMSTQRRCASVLDASSTSVSSASMGPTRSR